MTASSSSGTLANPVPLRQDARTIGLVGLAHGSSHFFHMLLPPLFPWLIGEFGFSYSELGMLVSVFFVISGVGQALSGFIVDRVGARPVMFFALSSFAAAGLAAGIAQGYWGLLLAAALAGLGNAPFHPVDFTILNKRVSPQRLGHGFSVHGISGNLGWATAPVFMAGIATAPGSWRTACLCGGLFALVVLAIMVWNRDALDDRQGAWVHQAKGGAGAAKPEHPMAFLKLPAVGMLIGGFLVGRVQRLEKIISVGLLGSAALLVVVGLGFLPGMAAVVVASVAGLGTGLAGPSRDMLIKRAAPPGATGRVYGTVYSGLDLGFCLAAPAFGAMLDHGMTSGIFYGSAFTLALSVVSAALVGVGVAARAARPLATAV